MTESNAFVPTREGEAPPGVRTLDIDTFGKAASEGQSTPQTPEDTQLEHNASGNLPSNTDNKTLDVQYTFQTIADMVRKVQTEKAIAVETFMPQYIEDREGLYYNKYRRLSEEQGTSVLCSEVLGFRTRILNPKLENFMYKGSLYYFDPDYQINELPLEEVKQSLAVGKPYNLTILREGKFLFNPIQVSIFSETFKQFSSEVSEQEVGSGVYNTVISVGIVK